MEIMFGTAEKSTAFESDSDSGDSLFVTQSVTSAKRTRKRSSISHKFIDEGSNDRDDPQHEEDRRDAVSTGDSGSDTSDLDYIRLHKVLSSGSKETRRHNRYFGERATYSFMKSHSGILSVAQNQTLMNAEVGGFFKCMEKLRNGQDDRNSPYFLCPLFISDKLEENDDDDDIKKVDINSFILQSKNTRRGPWLHTNMLPMPTKSKICQKGRKDQSKVKNSPKTFKNALASTVVKVLTESEEDPDTQYGSSSSDSEKPLSKSKNNKRQSQKSAVCRSPSQLLSAGSSFVQSFRIEPEENSENHPAVLATCTQSLGLHPAEELIQPSDCAVSKSDDETLIDETQWPDVTDPSDRLPSDGTEQTKSYAFDTHHALKNEDSDSYLSSQDLFKDLNNQTDEMVVSSTLKAVLNCDDSSSELEKATESGPERVLPNEVNELKQELETTPRAVYDCLQQTQRTKVVTFEKLEEERKKDQLPYDTEVLNETEVPCGLVKEVQSTDPSNPRKKTVTLPDSVAEAPEVVYTDSLTCTYMHQEPLEDKEFDHDCKSSLTVFKESKKQIDPKVQASPLKEASENVCQKKNKKHSEIVVPSELQSFTTVHNLQSEEIKDHCTGPSEVAESPLFNFGKISLLKRRKRKLTEESQPDGGHSVSFKSWEESPSAWESDGVSQIKAKKAKKKRKRHDVRSENTLIEEMTPSASKCLLSAAEDFEQLTNNQHSSPEWDCPVSQQDSSADSFREATNDTIPSDGSETRKKKKSKRNYLSTVASNLQYTAESICSNTEIRALEKRKRVKDIGKTCKDTTAISQSSDYESQLLKGCCNVPAWLEIQQVCGQTLQADRASDTQSSVESEVKTKKRRKTEKAIESTSLLTKEEYRELLDKALHRSANASIETHGHFDCSELLKEKKRFFSTLQLTETTVSASSITKTNVKQRDFTQDTEETHMKQQSGESETRKKKKTKKRNVSDEKVIFQHDEESETGHDTTETIKRKKKELRTKDLGQKKCPSKNFKESLMDINEIPASTELMPANQDSEARRKTKKERKKDKQAHIKCPQFNCAEEPKSGHGVTETITVNKKKQAFFTGDINGPMTPTENPYKSLEETSIDIQPVYQDSTVQLTEHKIKSKKKKKKDKRQSLSEGASTKQDIPKPCPVLECLSSVTDGRNPAVKQDCNEMIQVESGQDVVPPCSKPKKKKRNLSDDVVTFQESDTVHGATKTTKVKNKNKKLLKKRFQMYGDTEFQTVNHVSGVQSETQLTEDCERKTKKKSKKAKYSHGFEETSIILQPVDQNSEIQATVCNEIKTKKKKKKDKHSSLSEGISLETTEKPDQKKIKCRNPVDRQQDCDSEVHEESRTGPITPDGSKSRKKRDRSDIVTLQPPEESESAHGILEITVKKKKHRQKENIVVSQMASENLEETLKLSYAIPDTVEISTQADDPFVSKKKKKVKKKWKEDGRETVDLELCLPRMTEHGGTMGTVDEETGVGGLLYNKKKKKKKKKDTDDKSSLDSSWVQLPSSAQSCDVSESSAPIESVPGKKKKKKKRHSEIDLGVQLVCQDSVSPINPLDANVKKKKHKRNKTADLV